MCLRDDWCVQSYVEFISVMLLFKKHFWNDSFVISLSASSLILVAYLHSMVANDIFSERIWYLRKVWSHSELSFILKIKDQNEGCHF